MEQHETGSKIDWNKHMALCNSGHSGGSRILVAGLELDQIDYP